MLGSSYQVGLVGGSGAEPPPPLGPAPTWEDGDPSPPPPHKRRPSLPAVRGGQRRQLQAGGGARHTDPEADGAARPPGHRQPRPAPPPTPFATFCPCPPCQSSWDWVAAPCSPKFSTYGFPVFFFDQCPCSFLYESPVPHHTITSGHVWFFFLE